jgi:hypothetical protein
LKDEINYGMVEREMDATEEEEEEEEEYCSSIWRPSKGST